MQLAPSWNICYWTLQSYHIQRSYRLLISSTTMLWSQVLWAVQIWMLLLLPERYHQTHTLHARVHQHRSWRSRLHGLSWRFSSSVWGWHLFGLTRWCRHYTLDWVFNQIPNLDSWLLIDFPSCYLFVFRRIEEVASSQHSPVQLS